MMRSVLTLLLLVAVPLGASATGDADDHEICGEVQLDVTMAVEGLHKDEHVVEGIVAGMSKHLGLNSSVVKITIKFEGADAHAGHGHGRRLAVDKEIADYTITFPFPGLTGALPGSTGHTDHSAVTAALDKLKSTKASTTQTTALISDIKTGVVAAIAEAKAAGETIALTIDGGKLLTTPKTGHECHAKATTTASTPVSGSTMLSCFLGFLLLLVAAMF